MSIIEKQAIRGSILSYLGVGIGFLITGVLQPKLLRPEIIGVIGVVQSWAILYAALIDQGIVAATMKLFPLFKNNQKADYGYFGLLLYSLVLLSVLCIGGYLLTNDWVKHAGGVRSDLLFQYAWLIVPLAISVGAYNIIDGYLRSLKNATSGTLYKDVVQRLSQLFVLLGFWITWLEEKVFVYAYLACLILPAVLVFWRLAGMAKLSISVDWGHFDSALRRNFRGVAFFGMLAGLGGMLVIHVDRIMINDILGEASTGVYTTMFFFGYVISNPSRQLNRIAISVISDAWKENNLEKIGDVYQRSCLNQTVVALGLFLLIWLNVDNLIAFLPEGQGYEQGKFVVLLIALGQVINMATGANSSIIATSDKYKWGVLFMLLLFILVVAGNYILIPSYGIVGAAISSLLAMAIYNLVKLFFILKWYGLRPWETSMIKAIGIAAVTSLVGFVPEMGSFWVDAIIRSIIISTTYIGFSWKLGLLDGVIRLKTPTHSE